MSDAARLGRPDRAVAAGQDREAFARCSTYFAPRVKTFMHVPASASRCRGTRAGNHADGVAQGRFVRSQRAPAPRPGYSRSPATCASTRFAANSARGSGQGIDIDLEFQVDDAHRPTPDSRRHKTRSGCATPWPSCPDDQTRVIELSFFDEKAHAEIAQIAPYSAWDRQIAACAGHESVARPVG